MRFAFVPATVALVVAALTLPSAAQAPSCRPAPPPTQVFAVDIVVHGAPRAVHWLGGEAFVEGSIGERYVVRVHNPTWRRVEAVVSVDGRDVIDGQPSNSAKRGYVISPYSFVDIEGFRLSMAEVAAFRFTTVPDSYASRMGTPWAVGTIDVAFFPERASPPPVPRPYAAPGSESSRKESQGRDRSGRQRPPARAQQLGTEFGESRPSPVVETAFVRESFGTPAQRVRIRYDDRRGLCSKGLREFCPREDPPYDPYPYTSYPYVSPRRFSQPPPGWENRR